MITLKHILVATDFSEPSDAALIYGRELARTFRSTLHLVHVGTPVSSVVYGAEGYAASIPALQEGLDESARKQMDELLTDNDAKPLPSRRVLLNAVSPAAAIVDYAARERIDLI